MEDCEKKLDETIQKKQREREKNKQEEKECEVKQEANRKKAISFISDTVAPAVARATEQMHNHDIFATWERSGNDGTSVSIEAHKQGINIPRDQIFEYRIDMYYDPHRIEPHIQCLYKGNHNIKDNVQISEINEEDIYNDVWGRFINFAEIKL